MINATKNIKIRKANDRGHANHGWLDARFTFSFANYFDPEHTSFRTLRVMNNDQIEPGGGFGMHPHRDMEIITYVIEGELEHKDSMGNGSIIQAGNVQKITAGKGILHSEFNPSRDKRTVMYQIWIDPDQKGLTPSYQELALNNLKKTNGLTLIASNNKNEQAVHIHQDARLYFGQLDCNTSIEYNVSRQRGIWVQLMDGQLMVNDHPLSKGDGIALENYNQIQLQGVSCSEFLLFDLN